MNIKVLKTIFACIAALILLSIGAYGFLFNLNYWAVPILLGFIISGAIYSSNP